MKRVPGGWLVRVVDSEKWTEFSMFVPDGSLSESTRNMLGSINERAREIAGEIRGQLGGDVMTVQASDPRDIAEKLRAFHDACWDDEDYVGARIANEAIAAILDLRRQVKHESRLSAGWAERVQRERDHTQLVEVPYEIERAHRAETASAELLSALRALMAQVDAGNLIGGRGGFPRGAIAAGRAAIKLAEGETK